MIKFKFLPGVSGNYISTPPPFPKSSLRIDIADFRVDLSSEKLSMYRKLPDGTWELVGGKNFVPPLS